MSGTERTDSEYPSVLVICSLITNGTHIRPLQQDKEFRNECLLRRKGRKGEEMEEMEAL